MSLAETAHLAAELSLKGNFAGQLKGAQRALGAFDAKLSQTQGRGYRAGQQIGTGIQNVAKLAVVGVAAMAGALALAVKEGQDAAKVQEIYAQAVKNSGKVSADDVIALKAQQAALLNLSGVDDELIKSEQTRLIQMGLTGAQVAKLTPLILDVAKATGKDLLTVTLAVGKAVNGSTGALGRLGIVLPKAGKATKSAALAALELKKFQLAASEASAKATGPLTKQERALWAQRKAVLAAQIAQQKLTDATKKGSKEASSFDTVVGVLGQRFGGTTQALSGDFSTRLLALQENLKNIREDVGIQLLPALTRIVDVVATKLVPAFGAFVDRILPDINVGLNQFADALANGGAENAIRGITGALGPMIDLVKIAAAPVKAIVTAFLSLPKEVQTVLVGAFAVNKLTGGLVTNAAGGIIEAIGKGLLGGIKAPLVNVQGGVVNVAGGVPGAAGGAAAGAGGLTAAGIAAAIAAPVVAVVAVGATALIQQQQTDNQAAALRTQTSAYAAKASNAALAQSIDGVRKQLEAQGTGPLSNPYNVKGGIVDALNILIAEQNRRPSLPLQGPGINGFPLDTDNLDHFQTAITYATTATERQAAAMHKASVDLPTVIAGIRKRSAERFGGTGLGLAAVAATFRRDELRAARLIVASNKTGQQKLDALRRIQSLLLAHGDTKTAARIAGSIKAMQLDLGAKLQAVARAVVPRREAVQPHQQITVPVTVRTNTYINGRLIEAATARYTSSTDSRFIGFTRNP